MAKPARYLRPYSMHTTVSVALHSATAMRSAVQTAGEGVSRSFKGLSLRSVPLQCLMRSWISEMCRPLSSAVRKTAGTKLKDERR